MSFLFSKLEYIRPFWGQKITKCKQKTRSEERVFKYYNIYYSILFFRCVSAIFDGIGNRVFCFVSCSCSAGLAFFQFLQFLGVHLDGFAARGFRRVECPFVRSHLALGEAVIHELAEQRVEDGAQGHEDEHAGNAQELAADGDGEEDPDARQADGGTDDVRVDELAFDLLQNEEHGHEDEGQFRAHREDEQGGDTASEESAEDRDQSGDGDEHRTQDGVRHAENGHRDEEHEAEDAGFEDLTADEVREGLVGQAEDLEDALIDMVREQRIKHFLALDGQCFLAEQHVDREREADKERGYAGHNVGDDTDTGVEELASGLLDPVHRLFDEGLVADIHFGDEALRLRELLDEPGLNVGETADVLYVGGDMLRGVDDLRDDDEHGTGDNREDEHQRDEPGKDPLALEGLLPEELVLDLYHRHVHDERETRAEDEREDDVPELLEVYKDHADLLEEDEHEDDGEGDEKDLLDVLLRQPLDPLFHDGGLSGFLFVTHVEELLSGGCFPERGSCLLYTFYNKRQRTTRENPARHSRSGVDSKCVILQLRNIQCYIFGDLIIYCYREYIISIIICSKCRFIYAIQQGESRFT